MTSLGIHCRLRRLQGPGGRIFLFAADHGLPAGPLPGLEDPREAFAALAGSPVTGFLINPGIVRFVPLEAKAPLIVHLSAGTLLGSSPTSKVLACSVVRALSLGADAVSVQIHFGDDAEGRMLSDAGTVVDEADSLGLPVLVQAYPPGAARGTADPEATAHAARAAAEIGADLVQVPHPGTAERVRSVVRGCPVPVLAAGGPRAPGPDAFLEAARAAISGGTAGISVGRNLFQHPNPAAFAREIGDAVFAREVVEVRSA